MAGRRPKPTHLKVVTGNPGKRKLNDKEPTPAKEIPSPPAHLTDWGKVAWGRLTVLLDGMGVLTVADTLALERLCDIYADILQLLFGELQQAIPCAPFDIPGTPHAPATREQSPQIYATPRGDLDVHCINCHDLFS